MHLSLINEQALTCEYCGRSYPGNWQADTELWAVAAPDRHDSFMCRQCFEQRMKAAGLKFIRKPQVRLDGSIIRGTLEYSAVS